MKMKKIFAALSIVMLAVGCVKEENIDTQNNPSSDDIAVKDGYVRLELSTKSAPAGKTVIYGGQVVWETNDKITVFAGDNSEDNYEFTLKSSVGAAATFSGEVLEADAAAENFVVAYPYNENITLEGNTLSGVEIKADQPLVASTFGSGENPSVGSGGKASLEFRNLAALIRIPVYGPVAVKQIIITAPEGTVLAGKGTVDMSAQTPELTISESASNVITMDAETAVDATTGVNFYAVVAPQAADFKCDIKVVLEDGSSMTKEFADAEVVRAKARKADDFVAYETLVYYGSANCHIAKPGDEVVIDVTPYYMSGYDTCSQTENPAFTKEIASSALVWKEEGLTSIETAYDDGKLKVRNIAGAGNALVAIKDADGTILWSYHIWVPNDDPTATLKYQMHSSQAVPTVDVMPMNLGALDKTGAQAGGLYYQRGRKDPFGRIDISTKVGITYKTGENKTLNFYDASNAGAALSWFYTSSNANYGKYGYDAVIYGVQNPTIFFRTGGTLGLRGHNVKTWGLWGNNSYALNQTYTKSVFDPCPEGYRVPQSGLYVNFLKGDEIADFNPGNKHEVSNAQSTVTNSSTAVNDLGYYFTYDEAGNKDFYPLVGYREEGTSSAKGVGESGSVYYSTASDPTFYSVVFGRSFVYNTKTGKVVLNNSSHACIGRNVRCVKE